MKRKFTDQEFLELYNKGFNDRDIADKLNVTSAAVFQRRKKFGKSPTGLRKQGTEITDYTRRKIVRMYKNGKSMNKISKKIGIHPSTVSKILLKLQHKTRTQIEAFALGHNGLQPLNKRWKKLVPVGNTITRIISIPGFFLNKLDFKGNEEIYGKWKIKNGELILELKEKNEVKT